MLHIAGDSYMIDAKELAECLACGEIDLSLILDLNMQPLANSFISDAELNSDYIEPVFPLALNLCKDCTHLQLTYAVNPDLLFKNYLYVSGTSQTLRDYFAWFAQFTLQYVQHPVNVLDIACNDGSQLDAFKRLGLITYGIDPAENLYELSSINHSVICDYFTSKYVNKLSNLKLDIINAQNVFAHISNPLEFLHNCKNIMQLNTILFIQTSQADMIVHNEFDTIYHEHLSFFNTNSMRILVDRAGLTLIDVCKTPIHGNSYVFVVGLQKTPHESVKLSLENECKLGLRDYSTYIKYSNNVHTIVGDLVAVIQLYREREFYIVGYGAAAKGNTLLNFGNIHLDCIIDDNPLKQNLFAPGVHTPIVDIQVLDNLSHVNILFIPLAWNFYDEIRNRIKAVRYNPVDVFVRYFPNIHIEQSTPSLH